MPSLKETRFFSRDHDKGLPWYERKYYSGVNGETAVGDISPVYLIDERCPERIHEALGPEVKLIFMLRSPVDRAYSHYCMLRNHQFEDLDFEEAIARNDADRVAKSLKRYQHEFGFQYLKESSYFQSIQRYLKYFDRDRCKFVIFEEFIAEPGEHLHDILSFLGINDRYEFNLDVYRNPKTVPGSSSINRLFYNHPLLKKARDHLQLNTGWKTQSLLKKWKNALLTQANSQVTPMDAETRMRLHEYFRDETARLEVLLDRDLSLWAP